MTAYNFTSIQPLDAYPAKTEEGFVYEMHAYYNLGGVALVNGDTITTPAGFIPNTGVVILETEVIHPELDTNAAPTGTYILGDAADDNRYIVTAPMGLVGVTNAGVQMCNKINQVQTVTNGVVVAGEGYKVTADDYQLVLTVNGALATAATTGYIRLVVRYLCQGM